MRKRYETIKVVVNVTPNQMRWAFRSKINFYLFIFYIRMVGNIKYYSEIIHKRR